MVKMKKTGRIGIDESVRRYQTEGKPVTKKLDTEECPEGTEVPDTASTQHNVEGINFKKQTLGSKANGPGYELTKHGTQTLVPYRRDGVGYM
jgi:hypothetical protein